MQDFLMTFKRRNSKFIVVSKALVHLKVTFKEINFYE